MQNYKLYKIILKPRSPLHIGNREGVYNITEQLIHSDTLFSGIINCYSMLFGKKETDSVIDSFCKGDIPFRISSAMPSWDGVFYVYMPLSLDLREKLNTDEHKKVKKVRFIPEEALVNGIESDKYHIAGQFLIPREKIKDEMPACFTDKEIARIGTDRITHATNIYYYSQCVYGKDANLWFYLKVCDKENSKVLAAIKLLCDEGIGGERSIGLGCFDFTKLEIEEMILSNCNSFVNVSLYSPKNEQELSALMDYELAERAGYIYSVCDKKNVKRKKIKALLEGSTFNGMVDGRIFDVTPDSFSSHKVIKYALSYLLPYKA